MVFEQDERGN